jgi:hypothetical protein
MNAQEYLTDLTTHLSYLYAFARQMNELDFAVSLGGEFRGAQDAGWNTTITAHEVFSEMVPYLEKKEPLSKAEIRIILMLYCQLAEAGGVYETLKNIMGVVTLKPYLLWPFKDLVRVKKEMRRVVGPNANATFRDLATTAKDIGLSGLSVLLEQTFRDDIRNAIYHADYVIWSDGLRLSNRNGGFAKLVSFSELNAALMQAMSFFQILKEYNDISMRTFDPPKTITSRFSANFPMPWTVTFEPKTGAFGISGSSPGSVTTPEYLRQVEINGRLGGKVLAAYSIAETEFQKEADRHILQAGFEPNNVAMNASQLNELLSEVDRLNLWDERHPHSKAAEVLLASPWGFRWLCSLADFDSVLPKPLADFEFNDASPSQAPIGKSNQLDGI